MIIPQVAPQWYELGIELLSEDQENHLDIIKSDHSSDHKKCCTEMFWHWLRTDPKASWHQLVTSLRSPAVELPSVAADIEKMLQGQCMHTVTVSTKYPLILHSTSLVK